MKTFRERVKNLMDKSQSEDVKTQCNKVLEMAGYANEAGLRDMLLDGLKGIELSDTERTFMATEKKLTVLDTMGLVEAFREIYEGTILKDNPGLSYPLNAVQAAYQARSATATSLAEGMVKILQPYTFNPVIEKHVNHIKGLL